MTCSAPRTDKDHPDEPSNDGALTHDEWISHLKIARANLTSIKLESEKGTPIDQASIAAMEEAIARLEGSDDRSTGKATD